MREEWQLVAIYTVIIAALVAEVIVGSSWMTLGQTALIGVLVIAKLQAALVFTFFMFGKYGTRSVALIMLISVSTLLPLFLAFAFSIEFPPHAVAGGR
ncbi:MAG: hypothetical protein NXY59_04230 [Aigarchaeota archaeon]|nr:hypothetical protein [Candidatus Pelearchaeum maunauluense]